MLFALPFRLASVFAVAIAMSACQKTDTSTALSNHICEVSDVGASALTACKDGDLFAFLPKSWGNEQLPIIAAAQSCDFNKAVVYNNGGVTCVFNGARLRAIVENERKAASAPSQAQEKPAEAK
ncbi:hypothetical protein ACL9RI_27460 [Janthinobacterium sp. Mn2066]|uniref:hypothetical protein n=1 Tax=Janthinobacterium sp. Mn2066 TaxID=3395264 RepID=UPI003BEB7AEB